MSEKLSTIHSLAVTLGQILLTQARTLSVAESCTGGGLCSAITDVPGCSAWFNRGFITYSNDAKEELLFVPRQTLLSHGAVSEETACAMAEGALLISKTHFSISITGIAGPGGGSTEKPIGTVWIACTGINLDTRAKHYLFEGNRQSIRHQTIFAALQHIIKYCSHLA